MKKSIVVLGILILGIGVVSAQELKPFRISGVGGAMFYGGSGIGLEYVMPAKESTIGLELHVLNVGNNDPIFPWTVLAGITYYPFSAKGDGFVADIFSHYRFAPLESQGRAFVGATVGWRWIFLRFVNIGLHLGADYLFYNPNREPVSDGTLNMFNDYPLLPRGTISVGVAF